MNKVIVFYNLQPIFLYPVIAQRLGLIAGQTLSSKDEFYRVLKEDATHYSLLSQYQLETSPN